MKCHLKTFCLLIMLQIVSCEESTDGSLERVPDHLGTVKYPNATKITDVRSEQRPKPRYTEWSRWGNCDEKLCVRSRRRNCANRRKCGTNVQIEEKKCRFVKRPGRKHTKCGRKRRKNQNIVSASVNVTIGDGLSNDNRKYKFKIVEKDSLEKKVLLSKTSKWYSKWSRWSSCSRQCTTYRKRWCKRPRLCASDVIKETAYCYVEGTLCHRWIDKKIRNKKYDSNGELLVDTVIEELPNRERNDVDNTIYKGSNLQCGILYSGRNFTYKKSPWSMTRIIGGRQSQKGKWPWQVAILNKHKEPFCGGTLVAPQWVLTAAHCIRRKLYVRIGGHSIMSRDGIEMSITQTIVHPEYDSVTVDNDVALLRLPYRPYHQLGIACLPRQRQSLPMHKLCMVLGWGKRRISDSRGSDTLQEAQVPIVSTDVCKNTYIDYYITPNMFCAGYRKGHIDSCSGDSGGPLLCRDPYQTNQPWTIFGITSFGDGCGKRGKYGIYTRVPNFVRWINKVLRMNEYKNR